jgi:hypothetical protein
MSYLRLISLASNVEIVLHFSEFFPKEPLNKYRIQEKPSLRG